MKEKYATVGQLIDQKAEGVATAKKRAESLQQEAKALLLQASDKLQLLKGNVTVRSQPHYKNTAGQAWESGAVLLVKQVSFRS